jgi:hypothetical protein
MNHCCAVTTCLHRRCSLIAVLMRFDFLRLLQQTRERLLSYRQLSTLPGNISPSETNHQPKHDLPTLRAMSDPYSSTHCLHDVSHVHRDQVAIHRARLVYQYHDEIPLAPRDYGMPHQANTTQIFVQVRTVENTVAGLLPEQVRGPGDENDLGRSEEEQTRPGDDPIGKECESKHDDDW